MHEKVWQVDSIHSQKQQQDEDYEQYNQPYLLLLVFYDKVSKLV